MKVYIKRIIISILTSILLFALIFTTYSFAKFYKNNDLFILQKINIKNNIILDKNNIIKLTEIKKGIKLHTINLDSVKIKLLKNPYLEKVDLSLEYPSLLNIEVKEIKPLAFFVKNGKLCYLSEEGKIFGNVNHHKGFDLPIVRGIKISNNLLIFLKQTRNKSPFIYHNISEIKDYPKGLALTLSNSGAKVIVGLNKLEEKIIVLEEFIKETSDKLDYKKLEYIDLRFDEQVVLKDINS